MEWNKNKIKINAPSLMASASISARNSRYLPVFFCTNCSVFINKWKEVETIFLNLLFMGIDRKYWLALYRFGFCVDQVDGINVTVITYKNTHRSITVHAKYSYMYVNALSIKNGYISSTQCLCTSRCHYFAVTIESKKH